MLCNIVSVFLMITRRATVASCEEDCNGQQVPTHISCLFLSIFFLLRTCLAYFRPPRDLYASFLHYSLLFQIGQSFLLQPLSSQTLIFETSVHIIIVYNATLHVLRYSYLQHRLLPTLSRVLLPSSSSLVLQALALVYRLLEPCPFASTPRLFRSPPEPRSLFGIWALTIMYIRNKKHELTDRVPAFFFESN